MIRSQYSMLNLLFYIPYFSKYLTYPKATIYCSELKVIACTKIRAETGISHTTLRL